MAKAAKGVGDNSLGEESLTNFGEEITQCADCLQAEGIDLWSTR